MNESIFLFFHSFANKSVVLDWSIVFFAEYLPWIVIMIAIIFLWLHTDINTKEKWREIGTTFLTAASAYVAATILKIFIATDRPFVVFQDIVPLFLKHDNSFPSGHATFFTALAMAIFLKHKKIGVWFFVAALIIGIARVAAGVHFPVDILGGVVLGAGIAYFLKRL